MMNILFVSLGCDKNLVDSEVMLGLLAEKGYGFTDDEMEADVIVVNTCCFIGDAKEESVNTILEMAEHKKDAKCKALIVTGCMAQRYKQEIIDEIPEVDAVLGTATYDSIIEAVEEALGGEHMLKCEDIDRLVLTNAKRMLTTGGHYAHLKIAEGCDKHCTYCIIPKLRGNYRSFPMEKLVKEAEELAAQGVKELILVAQETTLYGTDIYGKKSLHLLLKELCKIKGIRWIRVQYCYPEEIYDELIQTMKEEPKVCNYLDLPIQHASDRILKRMGRRTSQADLRAIIGKLRQEIPDICLRTTLISGFPGETEEEFETTVEFIKKIRFYETHVFKYSRRKGTRADRMPDQIPEQIKTKRSEKLLELHRENSKNYRNRLIGTTVEVLMEEAQEIDGICWQVGHTREYVKVAVPQDESLTNQTVQVFVDGFRDQEMMQGKLRLNL